MGFSGCIPEDVRRACGRNSTARDVLMELTSHSNDTYKPVWPSQQTLAEAIGKCVSTVQRALAVLLEQGIIEVQARYRKGWRVPNEYRFNFDQQGLHSGRRRPRATSSPAAGPEAASGRSGAPQGTPAASLEDAAATPSPLEPQPPVWLQALELLQRELPESAWRTWVAPLAVVRADAGEWLLWAPDTLFADQVRGTYHGQLLGALRDSGAHVERLYVGPWQDPIPEPPPPARPASKRRRGKRR